MDEELADTRARIRDLCTSIGSAAVLVSPQCQEPGFSRYGPRCEQGWSVERERVVEKKAARLERTHTRPEPGASVYLVHASPASTRGSAASPVPCFAAACWLWSRCSWRWVRSKMRRNGPRCSLRRRTLIPPPGAHELGPRAEATRCSLASVLAASGVAHSGASALRLRNPSPSRQFLSESLPTVIQRSARAAQNRGFRLCRQAGKPGRRLSDAAMQAAAECRRCHPLSADPGNWRSHGFALERQVGWGPLQWRCGVTLGHYAAHGLGSTARSA